MSVGGYNHLMPDLPEGSIIAGSRLEGVAGRGGMGVVYRATQLALGRPVALKAIAADLAQDPDYRERFERESRLAASIDHPNIIPVYEAGEFDGTLYLIMRWVDGTDLHTVLRDSGRLPAVRAVRLLRPAAAALAAAHRAGLVHRDIKPANVLLARGDSEDEEHVYLTDFGIARRTSGESAMTRTGVFVGTIDYTAPERIEGGRGDAASDVYSFGCMMFETLTGHVPFARDSEVAKVFAHMNDPVPSARAEAPDVPEPLDAIIAKAMAKDPADRFASAAELAAPLGELLRDLDTSERARITTEEAATIAVPPTITTAPATPATPATPAAPATPATPAAPTAATERARPVRIHRPRRRLPLLLAGIGLLIVIGVVVALVSSGGGSSGPTVTGAGLSAGPRISLGGQPGALTAAGGTLWASMPDDGAIAVVRNDHALRFAVGGHPGAIAASKDGLWVAGASAGALARYSASTGHLEGTARLATAPVALAVDPSDSTVWAVDAGGMATHLSPTGTVLGAPASLGSKPLGVAAGEGNWLWAVNGDLLRVGRSGSPTKFSVGSDPVAVTLDQGVWTAHDNGHVTRFDPRSGYLKVNTDLAVAPSLDAIAAVDGAGAVWTISKDANMLYRISTTGKAPTTGSVKFGSAPVALAANDEGAWVATADGTVTHVSG
jgi:hypothetical protein